MGTVLEGAPNPTVASPKMEDYFRRLHQGAHQALDVAREARKKGWDPELDVEIVLAEDLAARVEAQTEIPGVADLVRSLTAQLKDREAVALEAARRVARGDLRPFADAKDAIDKAVRVGLSILTEGILVAPLEGIAKVEIGTNADGTDYCDLYFAGPIRAAGGTAQAMSVLLADVVRRDLKIGRFHATVEEIERLKEEIPAYKQAQHLQYIPAAGEIEIIVKNCPVSINGEGTEKEEVTGHRDLPRVATNQLRGGACLVIAEGLTQKAAKIMKHVAKLGLQDWNFLEEFAKKKAGPATVGGDEVHEIEASDKFIQELIAGRPVLAHPSRPGGFRLRYGRGRTCGIAATAISPVTMHAVDNFLAVGTQMKLERPGKGTIVTPNASLEGPTVLLDDGELRRVDTVPEWRTVQSRVRRITELGEILIPFGEFAENNSILPDASFTIEWWLEMARARAGDAVAEHLASRVSPPLDEALEWSRNYGIPLHPAHTLLWHDVSIDLAAAVAQRLPASGRWTGHALEWPRSDDDKDFLISLNCPHRERDGRLSVEALGQTLVASLGLRIEGERLVPAAARVDLDRLRLERFPTVAWVAHNLGVDVKPGAPTRVGARMGRPEKADIRKMDPPVHGLFPLANAGGIQRDVAKAAEKRALKAEVGLRRCPDCERETYATRCVCGGHTQTTEAPLQERAIPIAVEFEAALKTARLSKTPDKIKGVQGLISKHKTPEPLVKAVLRAAHEVYTFKDGTCRFDLTDAPLTHFRPAEVGTSVERLIELGYTHDIEGRPLSSADQLVELRVQDVVPSKSAGQYFVKVATFTDDLLEKLYGLPRFYNVTRRSDLVGQLVAGLAPHTSGAVLGRIIGFTESQVCWAHPFFHTGKRRNCLDGKAAIPTLNSPQLSYRTLEEIYDAATGPEVAVDRFGTVARVPNGLRVLAVDRRTGKVEAKGVRRVYRIPSPRHILRIRTRSGRGLACSPDHRLEIIEDGRMVKKKAVEVRAGDLMAFASEIPIPVTSKGHIDLWETAAPAPPWLVLRGVRPWLKSSVRRLGGLKEASVRLGLAKKSLDNFRRRNSLPASVARNIILALGKEAPPLPSGTRLAAKRDTVEVPRRIPISPQLMRLAGYYLAEGHARARAGDWFQVSIATSEPAMAKDIISCVQHVFGYRPRYNGVSVTLSGRPIHHFFTAVLGLGSGARSKRIPAGLASQPLPLLRHLLAAYVAGDGSVEAGQLHVSCTSASRRFLVDIGALLSRFGIAYRVRRERRPAGGAVKEFLRRRRRSQRRYTSYGISIRSSHAVLFHQLVGFRLGRKHDELTKQLAKNKGSRLRPGPGHLISDPIRSIHTVRSRNRWLYDLEVEDHHNFLLEHQLLTSNCDGDEDGLMLLLDALLNFSKAFIPDRRGGMMDLPLVLSLRIDPREIDKEAHNLDTLTRYPLAFYEATEKHRTAKELAPIMGLVEQRLGKPEMYEGLRFTLDTPSIQAGPAESSYKTLGTMIDKMETQLRLAEKLRAVDAGDVAGRVLSTHLLPDVMGNLKAFAKQKVRCTKCNSKYRRVPLSGTCTKRGSDGRACGNELILTVPQAGVRKYLDLCIKIAGRYPVPEYTKERVRLAQRFVDDSFAPEKLKKATLAEFA